MMFGMLYNQVHNCTNMDEISNQIVTFFDLSMNQPGHIQPLVGPTFVLWIKLCAIVPHVICNHSMYGHDICSCKVCVIDYMCFLLTGRMVCVM